MSRPKDKNTRISLDVWNELEPIAMSLEISVAQLIDQVLRREVKYRLSIDARPFQMPVGFLPDKVKDLESEINRPTLWLILYENTYRHLVVIFGRIKLVQPTVITIETETHCMMTLPRDALRGWQIAAIEGQPYSEATLLHEFLPFKRVGAFLHPESGVTRSMMEGGGASVPPGPGL